MNLTRPQIHKRAVVAALVVIVLLAVLVASLGLFMWHYFMANTGNS